MTPSALEQALRAAFGGFVPPGPAAAPPVIATDDDLRVYLAGHFGVRVPCVTVCPDHASPWDAVCDAYFGRCSRRRRQLVDTSFWHRLAARFRSRWDVNAEWNASGPDSRGHWRFIGVNTDIEAFKRSARLGAVALGAPDTADAFLACLDRLVSDSSD